MRDARSGWRAVDTGTGRKRSSAPDRKLLTPEIIEANRWTHIEVRTPCSVTQPRINDLLPGQIPPFLERFAVKHGGGAGNNAEAI